MGVQLFLLPAVGFLLVSFHSILANIFPLDFSKYLYPWQKDVPLKRGRPASNPTKRNETKRNEAKHSIRSSEKIKE